MGWESFICFQYILSLDSNTSVPHVNNHLSTYFPFLPTHAYPIDRNHPFLFNNSDLVEDLSFGNYAKSIMIVYWLRETQWVKRTLFWKLATQIAGIEQYWTQQKKRKIPKSHKLQVLQNKMSFSSHQLGIIHSILCVSTAFFNSNMALTRYWFNYVDLFLLLWLL